MKTYTELITLPTFEERFNYLKLNGKVGESLFGSKRLLNQNFYRSPEWKRARRDAIVRDNGCDLGIEERPIYGKVMVHHINPITVDDIVNRSPSCLDPDNLITVSVMTHEAITYGDEGLLLTNPVERKPRDTCPWQKISNKSTIST